MIKYECDVCGKLVNPAEAFGPEVDGGKSLEWVYTDSEADLAIGVFPFRRTDLELRPEGGYCKECVGKAIVELAYTMFPMMMTKKWVVVKDDEDDPGDSRTDRHLRKVRAESEVSEPSPDVDIQDSPIHPERFIGKEAVERIRARGGGANEAESRFLCESCQVPLHKWPPTHCLTPELHSLR